MGRIVAYCAIIALLSCCSCWAAENLRGSLEVLDKAARQGGGSANRTEQSSRRGTGRHVDNWAVVVDTSRYWFNYRHVSNTLAVYRFEPHDCKAS
eukprot:3932872-Rhodomonas_salina.5